MPRAYTCPPVAPSRSGRARGRFLAGLAAFTACSAVVLALALPGTARAVNFSAGQNADRMLGGPDWTSPTYHAPANMEYGTYLPNGVAVDASGSVYVADSASDRLMRWATTPATDGAWMTNVLQKASGSHASYLNTCSGGAQAPEQMTVTGDGATTRMAVADRYNHRVVLYTSEPTTDGATGTIFLGQGGGGSCSPDRSLASAAANSLDSPAAAWTNGTYVAVADTANNRVLLWDSFPATGAAATRVLGQADFDDALPDRGDGSAPTASTLEGPQGVWFDGTFLYVADTGNDRVLVWNGWPTTDGEAADYVIGFNDFVSDSGGCSNQRLNYPIAVATYGSGAGHRLAISTQNSNRVVVLNGWASAPTNYPTFSTALGQTALSACGPNRNGTSAAANSLRHPSGISFDAGGALWVADSENHRVVRFPSLATGTAADRIIGHPDAVSSTPMDGTDDNVFRVGVSTANASSFGARVAVAPDATLVATDAMESAVRIWTAGVAANNEAFDLRPGQTARYHAGFNGPGDAAGAGTMNEPRGAWTDGTRLLVSDTFNDRILVWTTMPTSDIDPADYVLGQATFSGTTAGLSSTRLNTPVDVTSDGVDVFVADKDNHRVLIYRGFWAAPADGKAADVVIGQSAMTNATSGRSSTRMNDPSGVDVDSTGRLLVADENNHRVLVYADHTALPATNGAADAVIGQGSFTAGLAGGAAEDVSGVTIAGGGAAWTNDDVVRVLDPIPTSGFVTSVPDQIGIGNSGSTFGQNRLDTPADVDAAAGSVWISNTEHGRLMRWTDTTSPTITSPPAATVRCDGTVTVSWTTSESTTTMIRWDSVSRASWGGGYANEHIDTTFTGLTHSYDLSFASPGTYYARVRIEDWSYPTTSAVESAEISFTVPPTCPAPTAMLGDDTNAQAGTGRANPSATNAPAIGSPTFHTSWLQSSGVTMDAVDAETWSTPPEHAGGLWHMDGSGATDPVSLASTSTIAWTGAPSFGTGNFGQAVQLDGSTQHGTAPHHNALSRANDFTVEAWFTSSDLTVNQYPVLVQKTTGNGCNTNCTYSLQVDQAQKAFCAIFTVATVQKALCGPANATVARSDGAWHHFALTVDSGNAARIYVDGLLHAGPLALGAPVDTNTADVTIGAAGAPGATNRFSGSLDEVRFAPVAYDAAAILGYVRTRRPHAQQLHDSGTTAIGGDCSTASRCIDQAYAGAPDILRQGARYWQRTRFNTKNNDYWSEYGVDWLETTNTASLTVTVGDPVAFGTMLGGDEAWRSTTVEVTSTSAAGYQLRARDTSDGWALEHEDNVAWSIPDLQAAATPPTAWPAGSGGGFGVTVRDATGNRLAKWGPVTGGFAEDDVDDNLYTGIDATSDLLLHERTSYAAAADTIVLTWRLAPDAAQRAGNYDGLVTLTAVATP